ncbi:protein Star-like [Oratosquilla oratoria]|uniref:protein Star-like n=1 Tax=Oratosquilla oratoria TaxID=337810 RepID=UPI003F76BD16
MAVGRAGGQRRQSNWQSAELVVSGGSRAGWQASCQSAELSVSGGSRASSSIEITKLCLYMVQKPLHCNPQVRDTHVPKIIELSEVEMRARGPLMQADNADLVQLLRSRYLDPPSRKPSTKHSNGRRLKDFLQRLFGDKKRGFFLEAGALDGQYLSNTLYLEQELGWSGLLVEPNVLSYRELQKKNRHAWSSNTCLSVQPYPHQHILIQANKRFRYASFLWTTRGSSYLEGHNFIRDKDRKTYSIMRHGLIDNTYDLVQCFPILTYLAALNVTHLDMFSMDVQGAEKGILLDFPWSKITVDVFVIEYIHIPPDPTWTADIFMDYMTNKGYRLYERLSMDYIFVHKRFTVA